jgi:mono/diheme cytochrome c family protein
MIRSFKGAVVGTAVFSLVLGFVIRADITAVEAQTRRASNRDKRTNELYNKNCARCHGADGTGDTPLGHVFNTPNLTEAEWWRKNANITSTRSLKAIVTRGKGGMPGFGKKLSSRDISLLVERMRRFRK